MAQRTITIATNSSQIEDVLIKDLGIIVPGAGLQTLTFSDSYNNLDIRQSRDIVILATDGAFGPGSNTLVVGDGSSTSISASAYLDCRPNYTIRSQVNANSVQTTSSVTYVAMPSMTISNLPSGVYLVTFSGTVGNSTAASGVFVQLFANTGSGFSAVSGSEFFADTLTANYRVAISFAIVTSSSGAGTVNQFELRWRAEANTASVVNRTLVAAKLSDG